MNQLTFSDARDADYWAWMFRGLGFRTEVRRRGGQHVMTYWRS